MFRKYFSIFFSQYHEKKKKKKNKKKKTKTKNKTRRVYHFYNDYRAFDISNITNIHKYLMEKHDMK